MEILVIVLALASVVWLLSKLRLTPPPSTPKPASTHRVESTPVTNPNLGRGLEALIPINQNEDISDVPPPPSIWSETELAAFSEVLPKKETPHLNTEQTVSSNAEIEWAVQDALTIMLDAGLFPQYQDPQALSQEIEKRCDAQTSMYRANSLTTFRWNYWQDAFRIPMEERHPWLDAFMLLAIGPEAGFALHNALTDGFTTQAFIKFGEACRRLSEDSLEVDAIRWQAVDDKTYHLRVGDQVATCDITNQSLWTVPLQFVHMLNAKLPDQTRRFEALTLLPIYGETLVFFLDYRERKLLETKRGWQFFDWSTLKGNTA